MLWSTVVMYITLLLGVLVVVVVQSLHATTSSNHILCSDTGSYDAGVVTSMSTTSYWDADSYHVFILLLVHELLVLLVVPNILEGVSTVGWLVCTCWYMCYTVVDRRSATDLHHITF
uniref:NADH dehydrogenase subunit 3 n=1 Tax=Lacrimia lanifica TaxID=2016125 RepID=A0A6G5ZV32_9EUGL|nr:NADH dehydrogenase subunit 3 [Lacrimia lanifica]